MSVSFNPPWFARGGHVQTALGLFSRRNLAWTHPVEDLVVDSEPGIRILSRATYQSGDRASSPALILLHGLVSGDGAGYMVSMGLHAHAAGYHIIRMNMRGAGESRRICPRLYHAGLEKDLIAVAREVAKATPRVGLFGVSLGANHVLLALGRSRTALPGAVRAGVALCPPMDLMKSTAALHRPFNRPYMWHMLSGLKEAYTEIQKNSDGFYAAGREIGIRSVREFDERITAPRAGFASADDYYTRSSSGPFVRDIDRPTLILAAEDDPIIPGDSVRQFPLPDAGHVVLEMHATGGHVGFTAPSRAPGDFWAADRALAFFDEHLLCPLIALGRPRPGPKWLIAPASP